MLAGSPHRPGSLRRLWGEPSQAVKRILRQAPPLLAHGCRPAQPTTAMLAGQRVDGSLLKGGGSNGPPALPAELASVDDQVHVRYRSRRSRAITTSMTAFRAQLSSCSRAKKNQATHGHRPNHGPGARARDPLQGQGKLMDRAAKHTGRQDAEGIGKLLQAGGHWQAASSRAFAAWSLFADWGGLARRMNPHKNEGRGRPTFLNMLADMFATCRLQTHCASHAWC